MNAPWVTCKECGQGVRYFHEQGHMEYYHGGPPLRVVPRAEDKGAMEVRYGKVAVRIDAPVAPEDIPVVAKMAGHAIARKLADDKAALPTIPDNETRSQSDESASS